MTFSTQFSKAPKNKADTIVIGAYADNKKGVNLTPDAKDLDKKTNGAIAKQIKAHSKFEGKIGQILPLTINVQSADRVIVIGLGEAKKLTSLKAETIGGYLFQALDKAGTKEAEIYLNNIQADKEVKTEAISAHVTLGLKLKSYAFTKYKGDAKKLATSVKKITVVTDKNVDAKKLFDQQSLVADGVFFARDLVNEPPNTLYPESYAKRIEKELKPLGVQIEILDEKQMKKLGFEALLSVGQGSIRQSRAVIMRWDGKPAKKGQKKSAPLALVGKGVTFDTGGISLKPGAEMDLMKMDMGGSAAVVGTMKVIASRKAKANVVGIVGLVENMPSDRAYRPGDIIGSLAGKTIEVLNTDAEGRLILADILTYVQQKYKPDTVIDLATLTGAIMVALGFEYCGTFANDDDLWYGLENASQNTGEKFWRMPLDPAYKKEMESEVADLRNLGAGRYAGACTAAGFLEHFIQDGVKWAHIDIAGTAWWKSDKPTTPKGGTGFAVRALDNLIQNHFEK